MPYYFDSSSAECEFCEAMEGWYEEEPSPPHPNCNCHIGEEPEENDEAVNFDWTYEYQTDRDPDYPNQAFIANVTVTVECYSGRTMTDHTEVAFDEAEMRTNFPDGAAYFDEIDDRVYEAAASLAEEMGNDCPPVDLPPGKDVDDDYAFA